MTCDVLEHSPAVVGCQMDANLVIFQWHYVFSPSDKINLICSPGLPTPGTHTFYVFKIVLPLNLGHGLAFSSSSFSLLRKSWLFLYLLLYPEANAARITLRAFRLVLKGPCEPHFQPFLVRLIGIATPCSDIYLCSAKCLDPAHNTFPHTVQPNPDVLL